MLLFYFVTKFCKFCIIFGHWGLLFLEEGDGILSECVQYDVCTDIGPPVLSPIRED